MPGLGTGEGAPLVAEQLALDEFMSGAVDCDERLARARRDPVNESRRYLLADAALTGDQQRAVDIGDSLEQ